MMRNCSLLVFMILSTCVAKAQAPVVLEGAEVINGFYKGPLHNAVVVIAHGKIAGVGKRTQLIIPGDAKTIDVHGKYIIPGLIDAHIHYDSPRDLVQLLAWGITSANCMFESTDQALQMERQTAGDTVHSPQIYATAPIFTTEHGWWWGEGFPNDSTINRFPTTPEEAREQVRKVKAKGMHRIKLMYDTMDWCRDPLKPFAQMKLEVMKALIDEANKQQLVSEIHAPKIKDAREVLEAGGSALAHGILDERFDAPTVVIFQNPMITYIPTFCVFEFLADVEGFMRHALADARFHSALPDDVLKRYSSQEYYTRYRERYPNINFVRSHIGVLRDNVSTLAQNYGTIALGTDMWAFPGIGVHLELEYMVQAGLTPMQAIISATATGGQFLNASANSTMGIIDFEKQADLIILDADPLADIRNTRSINTIIKHGVFFNPKALIEESKR
ncbi:MAG: amidohydrolase family protein [Ignavibacteria bacterium]|nr:amidohydrolase family protein [Ignavibacteria bacterium]MBI3766103.1 amidohydrolase family protein [Ignavibacteriales bacterium]